MTDIECGWTHSLILIEGEVESFGRNNFRQLGRNLEDKKIEFKEEIKQIVSGT